VFAPTVVGFATTKLPVVELKPVAGLQVKLVALLLAVKVTDCCPTHIAPPATVSVGLLITFIVAVAVFVQPFTSVPVTVYGVVTVGVPVTVAPVVELKPADHE
jgi:hypothetical protein